MFAIDFFVIPDHRKNSGGNSVSNLIILGRASKVTPQRATREGWKVVGKSRWMSTQDGRHLGFYTGIKNYPKRRKIKMLMLDM